MPYRFRVVREGTNFYAFVCNFSLNNVRRFDFGNSLDNTPTLGGMFAMPPASQGPYGIDFIQDNGIWYAAIVDDGPRLFIANIGATLSDLSNVTFDYANMSLSGATGMYLTEEGGNFYAFTVCDACGKLFRIDLGNSMGNPSANWVSNPIYTFPGTPGLQGFGMTKYCDSYYGIMGQRDGGQGDMYPFILHNSATAIPDVGWFNGGCNLVCQSWGADIEVTADSTYIFTTSNGGNGERVIKYVFPGTNITLPIPNNFPVDSAIMPIPATVTLENLQIVSYNGEDKVFFSQKGSNSPVDPHLYVLDFPNTCGSNPVSSTATNPSVSYGALGSHPIELTGIDANGNCFSIIHDLLISTNLVANFNLSPIPSCYGSPITFGNNSCGGNSPFTYTYNFGDATPVDHAASPTHIYTTPGTYTVTMSVTDASVPPQTNVYTTVVTISGVNPDFTFIDHCGPDPRVFTNTSSNPLNAPVTWSWNFGDGSPFDNSMSPAHHYANDGNYNVTLTAVSNGCTKTNTYQIHYARQPNAAFTTLHSCVGNVTNFTSIPDTTPGTYSYAWNFGDAGTAIGANTTHTYASANTYNVVLTVTLASNGCTATATVPVQIVNVPIINFSWIPTTLCDATPVTFTDLTPGSPHGWLWDFGVTPTVTSNLASPTFTFPSPGTYFISLTDTVGTDCPSTGTQQLIVRQGPSVSFTGNDECVGNFIIFMDQSTPSPGTGTITHWQWDFGDGSNTVADTFATANHIYTSDGIQTITLTVRTDSGCVGTSSQTVFIYPLPQPDFFTTQTCSGSLIQFTDNSTIIGGIPVAWSWNFGDGSAINTDQNPIHMYLTSGNYNIIFTVTSNHNCTASINIQLTIDQGPTPNFTYSTACEGQVIQFTDFSCANPPCNLIWTWDFGDGPNSTSKQEDPFHTYISAGTYNVTLIDTAMSGCVASITNSITVHPNPVANFFDSMLCVNSGSKFLDSSFVSIGLINSWAWDFAGLGNDFVPNPIFNFPDTGIYPVTLVVQSSGPCISSITKSVTVIPGPVAGFSFDPQTGFSTLPVIFTDTSSGSDLYFWDFGDSTYSTLQNPTHEYQTFIGDTHCVVVTQIVYNSAECSDTTTSLVCLGVPDLDISVDTVHLENLGDIAYASARVKNRGQRVIRGFDLIANLDGNSITEHLNDTLYQFDTLSYHFHSAFNITPVNPPQFLCVTAKNPNGISPDDNPLNDRQCEAMVENYFVFDLYPNPAGNNLAMGLIVPFAGNIKISLFDARGRIVKYLYDGELKQGYNLIENDVTDIRNGFYVVVFNYKDAVVVKTLAKM